MWPGEAEAWARGLAMLPVCHHLLYCEYEYVLEYTVGLAWPAAHWLQLYMYLVRTTRVYTLGLVVQLAPDYYYYY